MLFPKVIPTPIPSHLNSVIIFILEGELETYDLHHFVLSQGGWEIDETIEDAALRETAEEAGVVGDVEVCSSSFNSIDYEGNGM